LDTTDGTGCGAEVRWTVLLWGEGSTIRRHVLLGESGWAPDPHAPAGPEIIWPTWPGQQQEQASGAPSPLEGVRNYWSAAGTRLRDSAKWLAAVLGAALATLIGTSPLAGLQQHRPPAVAIAVGVAGLLLLGCTMLLVLQVMRPRSISFTDIQMSGAGPRWRPGNPLRRWKKTIESQQDLYLPYGVRCLTGLRQAMIVEEITLFALSRGINEAQADQQRAAVLCEARTARAARLRELRDTAAQVAYIGEFYHLRYRSTWATYCGILCGLLGAAAVIAAFTWPT
jgi:hypothetical protein